MTNGIIKYVCRSIDTEMTVFPRVAHATVQSGIGESIRVGLNKCSAGDLLLLFHFHMHQL